MLNKIKQWWKSRTIKAATIISVLGVVELNFHLLQDMLGEYYGLSFIVLSIIMGLLRGVTTTSINEK